jgi:hypothetical protein
VLKNIFHMLEASQILDFHIPLYVISLNDSEISDYADRIYHIELEISDNT